MLERLAQKWPARIGNESRSFTQVRECIEHDLETAVVPTTGPHHYSVLTGDIVVGLKQFEELLDTAPRELYRTKVEAFAVDLVRYEYQGLLIEFISPYGSGFPEDCLRRYGPGLHHLGFNTASLDSAVERLARLNYAVVSGERVCGPKGDVIFLTSEQLLPVHIELCQPRSDPGI